MVKEDFLVNNDMTEVEKSEKLYEFSDYSSDETDTLIDSNEEEEFLTPIQFTSQFGKKQAALSTSTPNLSIKRPYRRPSKRSASSPGQEGTSKRTKTKSKLPTIKKK